MVAKQHRTQNTEYRIQNTEYRIQNNTKKMALGVKQNCTFSFSKKNAIFSKTFFLFFTSIFFVSVLSSCTADTFRTAVEGLEEIKVTGVSIDASAITETTATGVKKIDEKQERTLKAVVKPSNATNKKVTWKSSDSALATVDANGTITGVKKGGPVTITVTTDDGSFTDKIDVMIEEFKPVTAVTIVPQDVFKGRTSDTWTITYVPSNASIKEVTWEIVNVAGQAKIVDAGNNEIKVEGIALGNVTVTATATSAATDGGSPVKDTRTIPVNPVLVESVAIDQGSSVILYTNVVAGKTITLTANVQPADAENKAVTWGSNATGVATVGVNNGKVTAVSKGSATITVTTTDGAKTDTSTITVKTAVETITLKPVKLVIQGNIKGNPKPLASLIKSITPAAASDKSVTWSLSGCSGVASLINGNSEIQPEGTGTCTLTATAADGQGATGSTTVTVTTPKPQNMIPVNVTANTLFTYSTGGKYVNHKFAVSQTEMTWELWKTVYDWAGNNGYTFDSTQHGGKTPRQGDGTGSATNKHPVSQVTWRNAMLWCNAYTDWYNDQNNNTSLTKVYYTDLGHTSSINTVNNTNVASIPSAQGGQDNPYVKPNANGFRLPTNIEWEFVARLQRDPANSVQTIWGTTDVSGGTTLDGIQYYFTPYNFASGADEATGTSPYSGGARKVAWFTDNSCRPDNVSPMTSGNCGATTKHSHIVGTRMSNGLDIYDMNGNVWEWVSDMIPATPPASNPEARYVRSGSWTDGGSGEIVVSYTGTGDDGNTGGDQTPSGSFDSFGFRVFQTCPTTGCSDLPNVD